MRVLNLSAALAAACLLSATAGFSAENVRLKSPDGAIVVTGVILSHEDGAYVMQTSLGQMSIPADMVSCSGSACPDADQLAGVAQ